jgi:hypothetical protein
MDLDERDPKNNPALREVQQNTSAFQCDSIETFFNQGKDIFRAKNFFCE